MPRLNEQNGGKVKPSGHKHDYTTEQLIELQKCENDVFYYIENYCWITHPTKGRVKFQLYEYQKRLIKAYLDNDKIIAMLSRQCGKTTTAAGFISWWALFKKDQKILIISKDQTGADEIMDRIWFIYEELPWFLKPGVKENNVQTKEFDNGSKIEALATTPTTGRGKSISLLYCDEFAYVSPTIADKFWTAVYPVLSTGGRCIITSTPNNDEDKFYKIWSTAVPSPLSDRWEDKVAVTRVKDPDEEVIETFYETEEIKRKVLLDDPDAGGDDDETSGGFAGFFASWTSVPWDKGKDGKRDEKFKREQFAAGLSYDEWLREFECSFVSADATLINATKLVSLSNDVRPPRFVDKWGCRWYEEILPNTAYAVVLDPSEGIDADDAVIQVWEIPYLKQVAEWHSNKVDQSGQAKMLMRVLRRIYNMQMSDPDHVGEVNLYYSVEKNGLGIGVLNAIEYEGETNFPGWLIDSSNNKGRGLITTLATKKQFGLEFKSMVERDLFVPRSKHLVSQMKTFVKTGQSYKAKPGKKDDIIMSCILMCHLIEEIRFHEPDLDDRVRVEVDDYDPNDEEDGRNMSLGILL